MGEGCVIRVTIAFSPAAREVRELHVELPSGSSVASALRAGAIEMANADLGIWGRGTTLDAALHDGDRVEIYRPLKVDPKLARRERFKKQGAKAAGLFASRRAGAKAGY
ncbi:RnfH family protein [Caenimonas sp. SL110]|uniref:RnfH family protein n=1 Tax=Caenimonas sp. SL110 TaxID=1450524 RepID=UPI000653D267|nr:RnfH family protein [Caenimonas sp. SL110]